MVRRLADHIDTDSEEWRHLCECRDILAMPFKDRKPRLDRIRKVRGNRSADEIEATMKRIFREARREPQ